MGSKQPNKSLEEIKNRMLGDYLRRLIAGENIILSGMCNKAYGGSQGAFSLVLSEINKSFAASSSAGIDMYNAIKIDSKTRSGVYFYNYFDLDTLVSYYTFLQKIVETIPAVKEKNYHRYLCSDDISFALKESTDWLLKNQNTPATHFYNRNEPIKPLLTSDGKFAPVRTMSLTVFDKKYPNEKYCQTVLDDYIEKSHNMEEDVIEFDGQTYYVERAIDYISYPDMRPIQYIEAHSKTSKLIGYVDPFGNSYVGGVSNEDGDFAFYSDGATVYRDRTNAVIKTDKIFRRSRNKNFKFTSSRNMSSNSLSKSNPDSNTKLDDDIDTDDTPLK